MQLFSHTNCRCEKEFLNHVSFVCKHLEAKFRGILQLVYGGNQGNAMRIKYA